MIDSAKLLTALKEQVKVLEADLRTRAEDETTKWAASLRTEFSRATARERTGMSWIDWRDGQVAQAAVAWIIASVFIRFSEDNGLLDGLVADGTRAALPWFAGPGDGTERAVENQSAFYTANPTAAGPDWLRYAFRALAALPAGRALVDPDHSMVWSAPISGEAADGLLQFWRASETSGQIVHDFTDASLDTRFLGDLYQDLSEFAKKQYALLQTPVFVEEFILDRTLTPAIEEFGLEGLKLIDPTCGSGHFLLGAFARLNTAWANEAPAMDARARVKVALASVHGIDLNPFAIAIARFRLTVAALQAAGDRTLVGAPDYDLKLAIGDSLLASQASSVKLDIADDEGAYEYANEDVAAYHGILSKNQYHVVVGNPPYITVKDPVLNKLYRQLYKTCSGPYALSVPFMELFFELAIAVNEFVGAGYVGQITSNSFMKREFGKRLIEQLLCGKDPANPVDLQLIFDSAGAWIPGHNFDGTPTVILVGRRRRPTEEFVRVVQSVQEDPGKPEESAVSPYWAEAIAHVDSPEYDGAQVSIVDAPRDRFARHPWSLAGGGADDVLAALESSPRRLSSFHPVIGRTTHTGLDEAFHRPLGLSARHGLSQTAPIVSGDGVREFTVKNVTEAPFPYNDEGLPTDPADQLIRTMWPQRTPLRRRVDFGKSPEQRGLRWFDHSMFFPERHRQRLGIAYAEVASHNHFVLDRSGRLFDQTAPVVKLPAGSSEGDYVALLGVLNSSVVCFWLKQVTQKKGGDADTSWLRTYQFNSTNLARLPLPKTLPARRSATIDSLARRVASTDLREILRHTVSSDSSVESAVEAAQSERRVARDRLVFEQEELDWEAYRLYGLINEDLTYAGELDRITLGQRAFEIALARHVAAGREPAEWFLKHGSSPIVDVPREWPADYRALVVRRLHEIESNPSVRLLERPDYKRRWERSSWDDERTDSLRDVMLDRLEAPELWADANGRPVARSVNELAELVRTDKWFVELAQLATGSKDVDFRKVVDALLSDESVPYLASLRYKPSGLEKFRAWERTWELQRAEDRGEQVAVPVPPKYGQADFRKPLYWKARGKLDVPKERFISYPGTNRPNDASPLYGWAGWNHADRAQALARLPMELIAAGATSDEVLPLVGGLLELQPWLEQWHGEVDPAIGVSPAAAISGLTDQLLTQTKLSRDTVAAWQPPAATRGRAATLKGTK
ncbi:BREX-2 system adenine-specific DNA-methyltransferase PglX [Agromyces italicus]|uniref:BREX-2 system adenine-specific DNA-methyltransferase PglX n=1 Tax=Agromyces italicus TaxID=279572 RepID=UPI0003B7586B|nr:BREX-2 system adenine-specific DNA-methyltransferase PglX [Agromyces italicus]